MCVTDPWAHMSLVHSILSLKLGVTIISKTKERRGEGRFGKKSNNCLANIEQQLMAKIAKKTEERGAFDEHHPHLMKRHVEQFQIHR